jgi:hypothetical protein
VEGGVLVVACGALLDGAKGVRRRTSPFPSITLGGASILGVLPRSSRRGGGGTVVTLGLGSSRYVSEAAAIYNNVHQRRRLRVGVILGQRGDHSAPSTISAWGFSSSWLVSHIGGSPLTAVRRSTPAPLQVALSPSTSWIVVL